MLLGVTDAKPGFRTRSRRIDKSGGRAWICQSSQSKCEIWAKDVSRSNFEFWLGAKHRKSKLFSVGAKLTYTPKNCRAGLAAGHAPRRAGPGLAPLRLSAVVGAAITTGITKTTDQLTWVLSRRPKREQSEREGRSAAAPGWACLQTFGSNYDSHR